LNKYGIKLLSKTSTTEAEPLVSFPPTYPLLLTLSGSLSSNRLNGAMWLHSLMFAANRFSINSLRKLFISRAAVVYFDKVTWRWYLPTRDELEHVLRCLFLFDLMMG